MGAVPGFRGFSLGGWGQPGPLRPERHPLRSGFELMPVCWTGGRSAARVVSLRISSTAFAGLSADAMSPVFAPLASLTIGAQGNEATRHRGNKAGKPRSHEVWHHEAARITAARGSVTAERGLVLSGR